MPVYDANITYTDVTAGFISESRRTLAGCLQRIEHCLGQLSEEEIWWRPQPQMNAVGNLLLHLSGNVTQWIIDALTNTPSTRQRQAEFDQRQPIPKSVLLEQLRGTLARADHALAAITTAEGLLRPQRVQAYDTNLLTAIFHCVTHFEGHAQEIIAYTRIIRGEAYEFLWKPKSKEQGAAP